MGVVETIALTMGIGWASGINLYATICTLGVLGTTGYLELPADLAVLQDPLVIFAAGVMYVVELFADKIPGFDTGWDVGLAAPSHDAGGPVCLRQPRNHGSTRGTGADYDVELTHLSLSLVARVDVLSGIGGSTADCFERISSQSTRSGRHRRRARPSAPGWVLLGDISVAVER